MQSTQQANKGFDVCFNRSKIAHTNTMIESQQLLNDRFDGAGAIHDLHRDILCGDRLHTPQMMLAGYR